MNIVAIILFFAAVFGATIAAPVTTQDHDNVPVVNAANTQQQIPANTKITHATVIGEGNIERVTNENTANLTQAINSVLGATASRNDSVVGKATTVEQLQTNQTVVAPSGQPRVIVINTESETTTQEATTESTTQASTTVVVSSAAPVIIDIVNHVTAETTTQQPVTVTTTTQPASDRIVILPVVEAPATTAQPIVILHQTEVLSVDVVAPATTTTTSRSVAIVQQPVVVSSNPRATSVLVGQPQLITVNEVVTNKKTATN